MDAVMEVCTPQLKRVLKTFQAAANSSLCGPGGGSSWPPGAGATRVASGDPEPYRGVLSSFRPNGFEFKAPPSMRAPQMPPPILIPSDRSVCEKSQTTLEGEAIACFVVGGEKRLCLPQILNSVLREFELQQINKACDELYIYCSRCTPEQLSAFKFTGVLPAKAPSCGLITKTDAERLCNALLHGPRCATSQQQQEELERDDVDAAGSPAAADAVRSGGGIRVYHKCFGKAYGILYPDAYVSETSKFIECLDCKQLMAVRRFVCHSHSEQENRVVHWGFDSDRWRSYVQLDKGQDDVEQLQAALSAVKARFNDRPKKRHQPDRERREGEGSCKRAATSSSVPTAAQAAVAADRDPAKRPSDRSAFHKWAPEQAAEDLTKDAALRAAASAGCRAAAAPTVAESPAACSGATLTRCSPPVLADPRRVVPLSEADRYGKHFVPNVSLAPPQQAHKLAALDSGESCPKDGGKPCDDWRVALPRQCDDDTAAALARLQAAGVAQAVFKSVAAMSNTFAEVLQHASSLDERRRLRLEECFSEQCARLEQLFGREPVPVCSSGGGAAAAASGAKKTLLPAAVAVPVGGGGTSTGPHHVCN